MPITSSGLSALTEVDGCLASGVRASSRTTSSATATTGESAQVHHHGDEVAGRQAGEAGDDAGQRPRPRADFFMRPIVAQA